MTGGHVANGADIGLERKQPGTLEIKLTDNSGKKSLKVHAIEFLWNNLMENSRRSRPVAEERLI